MDEARNEFGKVMLELILKNGVTLRGLARSSGIAVSTLSQVVNGKRKPPMAYLARWIEILKPTDVDRDRLIHLAHLAHCRPEIINYVNRIEREKLSLLAENRRLLAALACIDNPISIHGGILDCLACRTSRRAQ